MYAITRHLSSIYIFKPIEDRNLIDILKIPDTSHVLIKPYKKN